MEIWKNTTMISQWDRLKKPTPREVDEFGHKKDDPAFCAYTWKELTIDIGINFKTWK